MATSYTTLSSKGQMVIPKEIREQLAMEPGTRIVMRVEGTRIVLEPMTVAAKLEQIRQLRGSTAGSGPGAERLIAERSEEQARETDEPGW